MSAAMVQAVADLGPWFYDLELPGGVRTGPDLPDTLREIHRTRAGLLRAAYDRVRDRLPERADALDLACHQGYFSVVLRGLVGGTVTGVDIRSEHVRNARFVAESLGLADTRFERLDAERLDDRFGRSPVFDMTACFGLIYHLENPIGVLRRAADLTRTAMVIETQLVDDIDERVEWGRRGHTFPASGRFALIDESPVHAINKETGGTPLALCPSEGAVRTVLARCGFPRFERIGVPADAHEQFVRAKRAVFLATRA